MRRNQSFRRPIVIAVLAIGFTQVSALAEDCRCDDPSDRCDGGLLGCNPLPKGGAMHAVFGTLAGGIEHLAVGMRNFRMAGSCASERCGSGTSELTCDDSCDHGCDDACDSMCGNASGSDLHGMQQQSNAIFTPAPNATGSQAPTPMLTPLPANVPNLPLPVVPQPPAPSSVPAPPPAGSLFDEMRDPFRDDSASHRQTGDHAIQRATFKTEESDAFSDYFE